MTTDPIAAGTGLARDLALLERFVTAQDMASDTMAAGLLAMLAIVLVFLTQAALGRKPLARRNLSHRTTLLVFGPALAGPVLGAVLSTLTHSAAAPEGITRAEVCMRLYDRLAETPADAATRARVLEHCPGYRAALARLLAPED